MNELNDRLIALKSMVPDNVKIVAVSKTKPESDIMGLYGRGHKIFGENKVQELTRKQSNLPDDIEWHMIGHLQRNKVKYIAPFVHMIHAVDSTRLLREINKEAQKNERIISCLCQVHIAREETKFGFSEDELIDFLKSGEHFLLKNVNICGLMGMATFTKNERIVRGEFKRLAMLFEEVKASFFKDFKAFAELSMGMSNDYHIAIEEGSTIIRIGSIIFGERNYHT